MAVVEHRFAVMGSEAHLVLVDPAPGAVARATRRLRTLEARWSRFLPNSDISRLNRSRDHWVSVAPETITLIEAMQQAATVTAGAYDPTLLYEVLAAGYTASISDPSRVAVTVGPPIPGQTVAQVILQSQACDVWMPTGLALDPGGIGKGLASDLTVVDLLEGGTAGALVSVGGDLAVAGKSPTIDGWYVAIEDPHDPLSELCTIAIDRGGVATSSTLSRRWRHGGADRHHLIDPTTRRSSTTDLAAVTVVASSGWLAEAHATKAMLEESRDVIAYLESNGLAGLATTHERSYLTTTAIQPTRLVEEAFS